MGAGTKGHAGIQLDHQIAGLAHIFLPRGLHHQMGADAEGLVVLLPFLGPILVLDIFLVHPERTHLYAEAVGLEFFQPGFQIFHRLLFVLIPGKPALHQHILGHILQQLFIVQLPINAGLVRVGHIRPVYDFRSRRTQFHHQLAQKIRAIGGGMHNDFTPLHVSPFLLLGRAALCRFSHCPIFPKGKIFHDYRNAFRSFFQGIMQKKAVVVARGFSCYTVARFPFGDRRRRCK